MKKNEIISNLLNDFLQIRKDYMTAVNNVLSDVKNYSAQKSKIISDCDLSRTSQFNFFETISDLYLREKFHSDILFSILDSNTPEIGTIYNKEILEKFVEMLDCTFFKVDDTVKVLKEVPNNVDDKQGYVDLLITNNHKQAIIIENKINNASDMDNQLVRYMKYVDEQLFGNKSGEMRVVYLTLIPGKIPNIDRYDKSFSRYTEMLSDAKSGADGKILKYRSAVDSDKKKPDLVRFLNQCTTHFKDCTDDKTILKKVYMEQYKCLLNHIGGKAAMLEFQKELLQKIYSSQKTLNVAKDLVKAWTEDESKSAVSEYKTDLKKLIDSSEDNRKAANDLFEVLSANIIDHFINDCLEKYVVQLGFSFDAHSGMYKRYKTKDCFLYVYCITSELEIGFCKKGKKFKEREKKAYYNILWKKFKMTAEEVPTGGNTYLLLRIKPLSGKKNIEEFLSYYTNLISQII